ncbi:UDP-N-acetylmuramate dehydrogenase [Prolixibacteraceae bacterium JC049]|nr:UDP-N-acetylmuramate dehydrogenase [Prolixibacteraceae bacterium JC049]
MRFQEDYSLKRFNTFGVEAKTKYYFEFTESEELVEFIKANESFTELNKLILGGGSNYLFISDFDGIVLHPAIPGIRVLGEDHQWVYIEAGAGVIWDDLVEYAVNEGWGGMENLSAIPGNIGATPVQNIGAYGAEAADVIHEVNLVMFSGERRQLTNPECQFGYRQSIFKNELRDQGVVTSVVFKLAKEPIFNLEYGAVKDAVEKLGEISLKNIRKAIIEIRDEKLPAPTKIGSGGSFFMNPVVDAIQYSELISNHPKMPSFKLSENEFKVAAGWLIDQCGWKGYRKGDAGVHDKQALVLVNHGNATGEEIARLACEIQLSVKKKFNIELYPEVIIVGKK